MKIPAAVVLSAALSILSVPTPTGSAERPPVLIVRQVSPAVSVPAFDEFYREFHTMLMSWWDHGGQGAARGTWQVIVAAVTIPGEAARARFVVSVAEERDGAWHLVFTFAVPTRVAVAESFLAAHAAYDATMSAILGQLRGTRLWLGPGGGETARLPAHTAPTSPSVPFLLRRVMLPSRP